MGGLTLAEPGYGGGQVCGDHRRGLLPEARCLAGKVSIPDLKRVWFEDGSCGLSHQYEEGYVFDGPAALGGCLTTMFSSRTLGRGACSSALTKT